jgi:uncharacterized protein (TIGR00730 family)
MRSICVFCGSKQGEDRHFTQLAQATGVAIARAGVRMVYGGAEAGLMGVAARAALKEGGEVLGIIPEFLIPIEGAQHGADIRVTATMASRKAMLVEEADAFLVLPGGFGTLEEIFDMIRMRQNGSYAKPACFIDAQFWAPLEQLMRHIVETGFADADALNAIDFQKTPEEAVDGLLRRLAEPV